MIVLDASLLVALLDERDSNHTRSLAWYGSTRERMTTTPLILGEVDYFARTHIRPSAAASFRRDIAAGAFDVTWWDEAPSEVVAVADRYGSLDLSLADASLVVLAAREATTRIATFDERDFRMIRPLTGAGAFTLLPADA